MSFGKHGASTRAGTFSRDLEGVSSTTAPPPRFADVSYSPGSSRADREFSTLSKSPSHDAQRLRCEQNVGNFLHSSSLSPFEGSRGPGAPSTSAVAGQVISDACYMSQSHPLDGSDVVSLLSRDVSAELLEEDLELSTAQPKTFWILPGQTEGASFPPTLSDDDLSFIPDFLSSVTRVGNAWEDTWKTMQCQHHMGVCDLNIARELWIKQWDIALVRYIDVVWNEVPSIGTGSIVNRSVSGGPYPNKIASNAKAVVRLRGILHHLH